VSAESAKEKSPFHPPLEKGDFLHAIERKVSAQRAVVTEVRNAAHDRNEGHLS
jgi:hypothetical protein